MTSILIIHITNCSLFWCCYSYSIGVVFPNTATCPSQLFRSLQVTSHLNAMFLRASSFLKSIIFRPKQHFFFTNQVDFSQKFILERLNSLIALNCPHFFDLNSIFRVRLVLICFSNLNLSTNYPYSSACKDYSYLSEPTYSILSSVPSAFISPKHFSAFLNHPFSVRLRAFWLPCWHGLFCG